MTDFSKFDRPAQLHVGFQALDAFEVSMPPRSCTSSCAFDGALCMGQCRYIGEPRIHARRVMSAGMPACVYAVCRTVHVYAMSRSAQAEKGHAPRPANAEDADRVIALAKVSSCSL